MIPRRGLALPFEALLFLGALLPAASEVKPPTPEADYAARAKRLSGKKDPAGWLELANFCEAHLLWDKRKEALRKAVATDTGNPEARLRLGEVKVGKSWIAAEQAEAEEARRQQAKGLVFYGAGWEKPEEVRRLRQGDRDRSGWDLEVRVDTPHVVLYSARPVDFSRRLAAILESEIAAYRRLYATLLDPETEVPVFKVYLFKDRETFERILEAESGMTVSPGTAGGYSYKSKVLYIGVNPGETDASPLDSNKAGQILNLAAHEMAHGLDHQLLGQARVGARWLSEGTAEYFGYAVSGRQVIPGMIQVPPFDTKPAALASALPSAKLSTLCAMGPEDLGAKLENYALAWAFVHFLLHGESGKHAASLLAFQSGCPAEASLYDLEAKIGKLSELEPVFKVYVEKQFLPAVRASQSRAHQK